MSNLDAIPPSLPDEPTNSEQTNQLLRDLIQPEQYVGVSWTHGFDSMVVQLADRYKEQAGGIPLTCFLIATRLQPPGADLPATAESGKSPVSWSHEDACILLLRVTDTAPMPNEREIDRLRAEAGQRSFDSETHWDSQQHMDPYLAFQLQTHALKCRIVGTFYLNQNKDKKMEIVFGSDISNFYPNRGLRIYKPVASALQTLINYCDPDRLRENSLGEFAVRIGRVRYASTDRQTAGKSDVPFHLRPIDIVGQKTASGAMTRMGKSNLQKLIMKATYELRNVPNGPRVGQVHFDVRGEYSNRNVQDADASGKVAALADIAAPGDCVIYGHPKVGPAADKNRKPLRINFHEDSLLSVGKDHIDEVFRDHSANYVNLFTAVTFEAPDDTDASEVVRYFRAVLAYRALLNKNGLPIGPSIHAFTTFGKTPLFSRGLLDAMRSIAASREPVIDGEDVPTVSVFYDPQDRKKIDDSLANQMLHSANLLEKGDLSWSQVYIAMNGLARFLKTKTYTKFNRSYAEEHDEDWADPRLRAILGMYEQPAAAKLIQAEPMHSPSSRGDYTDQVYADLKQGRLVIIDLSVGKEQLNRKLAERIVWKIYNSNLAEFQESRKPTDLVIYVEEAHNLMPPGSTEDTANPWATVAKEGGKLNIGMVYATQKLSRIQHDILSETANWFIGHLNNADEIKEIVKFKDFADFGPSIAVAEDRGFLRVRTLSNRFVVPLQIDRFKV